MAQETEKLIEAAREWLRVRTLVMTKIETERVNLKDPKFDLGDREWKLAETVWEYEKTHI